ncbi:MAG: hypothetical protein Q4C87_02660 [Actinomycetaceae bacterium]|nr:hypothetical protein [Actinomycetaceae bacterium]
MEFTSALPNEVPPWEVWALVAHARILATHLARRAETIFGAQSALEIWGIDAWVANPDVYLHRSGHPSARTFPEVTIGRISVPHAVMKEACTPPPPTHIRIVGGLHVTSLEWTALQMALSAHPLEAMVAVSGILRCLSRFDRFDMTASRTREGEWRQYLLSLLNEVGARRGTRQARAILSLADAGCESVLERALLWVLTPICPPGLVTQYEVQIHGRRYFLDCALPEHKIAFEADGAGKLGLTQEEFHREKRDFLRRQQDLEDDGWTVIRVNSEDFDADSSGVLYSDSSIAPSGCSLERSA